MPPQSAGPQSSHQDNAALCTPPALSVPSGKCCPQHISWVNATLSNLHTAAREAAHAQAAHTSPTLVLRAPSDSVPQVGYSSYNSTSRMACFSAQYSTKKSPPAWLL